MIVQARLAAYFMPVVIDRSVIDNAGSGDLMLDRSSNLIDCGLSIFPLGNSRKRGNRAMAKQDLEVLIQGEDLNALVREFRAKPTGQHSAALQRLINRIRSEPMEGKLALLCTKPHEEWRLVQMNGRARPMTLLDGVFNNLDDAEWAIFKLRMKRHFDIDLAD